MNTNISLIFAGLPLNGTDSNNCKHLELPPGSTPRPPGLFTWDRRTCAAQELLGAWGLSLVTPEGHGNWNPVRQLYINHQDRVTGQQERGYISKMFHEKHDRDIKKNFPKVPAERFAAPARLCHLCRFPTIIAAVRQVKPAPCKRAYDTRTQMCAF